VGVEVGGARGAAVEVVAGMPRKPGATAAAEATTTKPSPPGRPASNASSPTRRTGNPGHRLPPAPDHRSHEWRSRTNASRG